MIGLGLRDLVIAGAMYLAQNKEARDKVIGFVTKDLNKMLNGDKDNGINDGPSKDNSRA